MIFSEIPILVKNDRFVAVDKTVGLSVHNNEDPTNLLQLLERQLLTTKLYPVHRLDKETSGVQILALSPAAAKELSEEFQKHAVEKHYIGILRGQLKNKKGVWVNALTDKAEGRKNPQGLLKGRVACETQYSVKKESKYFSLCEFNLITGRQHQIRKHAALTNHALVGDARYGDQNYNKKIAELYNDERMFLHCANIVISGQSIPCAVPEIFERLFSNQV